MSVKAFNVCPAEKRTKRSSTYYNLLRLVRFSAEQKL